MSDIIPVVLFAYNRPHRLLQTLEGLKANGVPLIYAFSDGPKTHEYNEQVKEVRNILRAIDWCDIRLVEREVNFGLGKSILAGVSQVFEKHNAIIVFEDDLVCAPGSYAYLCRALEQYENEPKVMSVTGWTHPRVTPQDVTKQPYFDGRAECLMWGTWRRAWDGMDRSALSLLEACEQQGIDIYRYGADLPRMARKELERNIWAVRFSYLHILEKGLCLRPPWSMIEHVGYDPESVNVKDLGEYRWHVGPLRECPPLPSHWIEPVENKECSVLWQNACGTQKNAHLIKKRRNNLVATLKRIASMVVKLFSELLTKER